MLLEDEDNGESIACFCVHPNGSEIVVAMQNFLLRHYNLDTKELIRSFRSHHMPVLAMDYDSTGTLVATGSADKSVRVWDVPRGYCTHSFREHNGIVNLIKFHPDPARLVLFSASDDCTLRMYDLVSSACVAVFRQHMSGPTDLSFSDCGNFMVSVARDQVNINSSIALCLHIEIHWLSNRS